MTREEVLKQIYGIAIELIKNYSRPEESRMWDLAADWNREHEDDEIFLCETENGFAVEDDMFVYEEN